MFNLTIVTMKIDDLLVTLDIVKPTPIRSLDTWWTDGKSDDEVTRYVVNGKVVSDEEYRKRHLNKDVGDINNDFSF